MRRAVIQGRVPELLLTDSPHPCPYFPDRMATLPLRYPLRDISPVEFDDVLADGDRRNGPMLYRPQCASCDACEAIRIRTDYQYSTHERRVLRNGNRSLRVEYGPLVVTQERVDLYNLHSDLRGLADNREDLTRKAYREFLVDRNCKSLEFRYFAGDVLVGVGIADLGRHSLSAVYCYYDPRVKHTSIGTYSILRQVEYAKRHGMKYVYLGLYVRDSAAMAYKARYLPHERLIGGRWTTFSKLDSNG